MSDVLQLLLIGGVFFLIMRFGCGSHGSKGTKIGGHGHKHGHEHKHGGGCCGGGTTDKTEHNTYAKHNADKRIGHKKISTTGSVQHGNMPPEKDIDPVCAMEVVTKTAKSSTYDGLVYFFCSQDCLETFEATPKKYTVSDQQPESPRLKHQCYGVF